MGSVSAGTSMDALPMDTDPMVPVTECTHDTTNRSATHHHTPTGYAYDYLFPNLHASKALKRILGRSVLPTMAGSSVLPQWLKTHIARPTVGGWVRMKNDSK